MQGTLQLERQYADFHALGLPPDALDRWDACRTSHRFSAFKGKQVYIFCLQGGKPKVTDVLTCVDVDLSLEEGIQTYWSSHSNGGGTHVGHLPVEVGGGLFLWHMFFSDLSYTPYNGTYSLRLPLLYRSPHNIHKYRVDGVPYILERAVYDSMFGGA